eukprot:COSAG06_NODE_23962_length_676_cov_1.161179_1_plen_156_part_10
MLVDVDSASNGGDRADNCDDWAQNEGHNIGYGSQLAARLAPHTTDGTNFNDFCTAAGNPQAASNAACNGVPAEDVAGVCLQLGGPGPAVGMLCGQLGFSTETCAAIVEGMPDFSDVDATTHPARLVTTHCLPGEGMIESPEECQAIAAAMDPPPQF